MLTEARESGADDVSTWSTYVRAPGANRSDPFRESPVEAIIGGLQLASWEKNTPTHDQDFCRSLELRST